MKLPKKAEKMLKLLEDIEHTVQYFSGDAALHKKDFKAIRNYIAGISESKKLSEIKLAAKIKADLGDSDS